MRAINNIESFYKLAAERKADEHVPTITPRTVVVTAGLSVRGEALSRNTQEAFVTQLTEIIARHAIQIHTRAAYGTGEYEYADGQRITEDSVTFVATVAAPNLRYLKADLSALALTYDQESIAVIVGKTEFVAAGHSQDYLFGED